MFQDRVTGGIRTDKFLMRLAEMGLQGVDRFEPDRDPTGIDIRCLTRWTRQRFDQRRCIWAELDRVAVRLWTLTRQVRIPDHKRTTQQHVTHITTPSVTSSSTIPTNREQRESIAPVGDLPSADLTVPSSTTRRICRRSQYHSNPCGSEPDHQRIVLPAG